jgi:hypothetical protein
LKKLEVLTPGSEVSIKGIKATCIAVQIETSFRISYFVSWWNDRDRKMDWLPACEVAAVDEADVQTIGFKE